MWSAAVQVSLLQGLDVVWWKGVQIKEHNETWIYYVLYARKNRDSTFKKITKATIWFIS